MTCQGGAFRKVKRLLGVSTGIVLMAFSAAASGAHVRIDLETTAANLRRHVQVLTVEIGERSVNTPENHARAAAYIENAYRALGMTVTRQPYPYGGREVSNIIAERPGRGEPKARYILGAHYDSVAGTVGADDNASAVAVQLEVAARLAAAAKHADTGRFVRFVSFALEEPPAYETPQMGSRVYAEAARRTGETIDGMICLEMVGYTCRERGCQSYPFPLMFFGYPDSGDFIGIVGDFKSRHLTRGLVRAFAAAPDLPTVSATIPLAGWLVPAVRLSDHASFWDRGYAAVMVTDSAFFRNPYYHTAADTAEKLDYGFMARLVEGIVTFFGAQPDGAR